MISLISYLKSWIVKPARTKALGPCQMASTIMSSSLGHHHHKVDRHEIHQTGLKEVDRIHGEMKKIMKKVGFKGDLKAFFNFMKSDRFLYSLPQKRGEKHI